MELSPVQPVAWAVSVAGSLASFIPCAVILAVALRSAQLRELPARLPLHAVFLNGLWALLNIISIALSVSGIQLPCIPLGLLNHVCTVSSILWFAVIFIDLQRTMSSSKRAITINEELQYVVLVYLAAILAALIPFFADVGVVDLGDSYSGSVYMTMANGICYISPQMVTLRIATVTAIALGVLAYMIAAFTSISLRLRRLISSREGLKLSIVMRCFRYIFAFMLIWILWIGEDLYLVVQHKSQPDMPVALEAVRAMLFYSQGAIPAWVYGINKWSFIRLYMPRWFVGLMNKCSWLLELVICEGCFGCFKRDGPPSASFDYSDADGHLMDGQGDAWDIAVEVADAIEAAMPKRRKILPELSMHPTQQQQFQEPLLHMEGQDTSVNASTAAPIAIPAGMVPAREPSEDAKRLPAGGRPSSLKASSYDTRSNLAARSYKATSSQMEGAIGPTYPPSSSSGAATSLGASKGSEAARLSRAAYRSSPYGHARRTSQSPASHSSNDESDFEAFAANLFSKSPEPKTRKASRAEEMLIPSRGKPVHVYHIGSYNSSSGSFAAPEDLNSRTDKRADSSLTGAQNIPASMVSNDDRQFVIRYDDEAALGVSLPAASRSYWHRPSALGSLESQYLYPDGSYTSDGMQLRPPTSTAPSGTPDSNGTPSALAHSHVMYKVYPDDSS
jgi:hypothetical protein